ncbi:MAG: KilA-N domain-containing protein [Clostridium sp.]|nr:KilA-N domain-containing protein [Clostridium sp.]
MSPQKWIKETNAIGIISKSGNNGGTFAHSDIAFEFASWLSPEFKLYLIQEFERLKKNESYQYKIEWHANRILSKVNYLVHTDAVKMNILPVLTEEQKRYAYAEEADVLNVALFGLTAKQWRIQNSDLAKQRQIQVINKMIENNFLTENEEKEILK